MIKSTRICFLKKVKVKYVASGTVKWWLISAIWNWILLFQSHAILPICLLMVIWRSSVPLVMFQFFHHPPPCKEWILMYISEQRWGCQELWWVINLEHPFHVYVFGELASNWFMKSLLQNILGSELLGQLSTFVFPNMI